MSDSFFDKKSLTVSNFKAFVKTAGADDFVFLLNLSTDSICLSDEIVKVLSLPGYEFDNAMETLAELVHADDKELLLKGFERIKSGGMSDFIAEYRFKNEKGNYIPVIIRGKLLEMNSKTKILAGMVALKSSHRDDITGLPLEMQMVSDYNDLLRENGSLSGFILAIRIEGLERINENFGLDVGDKIFNLVANACETVRDEDTSVYRISGNKIAMMNVAGKNAQDAQDLYATLKRKVSEIEYNLDYAAIFTISSGVVAFVNDSSELKDLLKKADFSLSMGKKSGKNNLYLFNSVEYTKHINKLFLREKLRDSVKNDFKGFEMYYQPVVDASKVSGKGDKLEGVHVIGAEALLRWSCPEMGLLGADQIIPILEESGLIAPVGRWILIKTFTQCKIWNEYDRKFHMSVNLSYMQFERSDILLDVQMALEKSGVNPENIILEITESGYIDHVELQKILDEFHKLKIRVDIDDFGTGYSNLRYIQNLHANTLKLDYTFVHKAVMDKGGESERKVIEYIINMAHDLGMNVCLEGVESESDVEILAPLKADKYQGYLFGKPVNSYAFLDENRKFLFDRDDE
ncbi:EAL domain-containing protein [Treponema sp.]|uniref:EAL domain-containing protein n=1 Tax=Treponema sp. TaxID=166 RepID=UPI00298E11AB|nr:EAL domain-containing protein [Treponema sp.]MCR5614146.1 EAL domain-containing protein [Treponema sp.]